MFCSLYVYLKAPQSFLKIKYAVKMGRKGRADIAFQGFYFMDSDEFIL